MVRPTDARMIELIHLGRSFRRADGREVAAVSDVSLTIPEGEFVCLIGTSGCGKSTLLSMIAGLLAPTAGSVVVDGREVDGPGPERGMVFQKDSVFPWMRVVENVEYGCAAAACPRPSGARWPAAIWSASASPMSKMRGRASCRAAC